MPTTGNSRVLVLAPHADDEVLGMGGTIARMVSEGCSVVVAVLTGHGEDKHPFWSKSVFRDVRREAVAAISTLGVTEILFRELPAACLDSTPIWKINGVIEEVIGLVKPDQLYVPFAHDLHKDHGLIAYATTVSCRPYLESIKHLRRVLAYETLSETHLAPPYLSPAFQPNVFVDITRTLDIKLAAMRKYTSQIQPEHQPRSLAAINALAVLRGTHMGSKAGEAFVLLGEYVR